MLTDNKKSAELVSIDRGLLWARFEALAECYKNIDSIDDEASERLLSHLDGVLLQPRAILDLGSGIGRCAAKLAARYPSAQIVETDFSPAMLRQSRRQNRKFFSKRRRLCADLTALALADNSVDLAFSTLSLTWSEPLPNVVAEIARVLRPGGLVATVLFGPDTLKEFRDCWAQNDETPHVHSFIDMHDLGDLFASRGFKDIVVDSERLTLNYAGVDKIYADLRQLGLGNLHAERRRTLTGKSRYKKFIDAYECLQANERLPLTCELIYLHAWQPEPTGVAVPATHF